MGATSYIAGTDNPSAVFYAGSETINRHLELLEVLDPPIWDHDTLIIDEVSGSFRPLSHASLCHPHTAPLRQLREGQADLSSGDNEIQARRHWRLACILT